MATAARELAPAIDVRTIQRAIQKGELPATKRSSARNSPYRISLDALRQWAEERDIQPRNGWPASSADAEEPSERAETGTDAPLGVNASNDAPAEPTPSIARSHHAPAPVTQADMLRELGILDAVRRIALAELRPEVAIASIRAVLAP